MFALEKIRLYVWAALAAVLMVGYLQWQKDYPPPPNVTEAPTSTPAAAIPELPGQSAPKETATPQTTAVATTPAPASVATNAPRVEVRTDVLDLDISTQGGDLVRTDLIGYPVHKDHPEQLVRLFDANATDYFVAHSGLLSSDQQSLPNQLATFSASMNSYILAANADTLQVPLTWSNEQGVKVTKTYTFKRGEYSFVVDYKVENNSGAQLQTASYVQLARHQPINKASMFNPETYAFLGPAIYDGNKFNEFKLTKEDSRNYSGTVTGGWISAMQHHFVVAVVPPADQAYDFKLAASSAQEFALDYRGPLTTIASGATAEFHETFFTGPKIQSQLQETSPELFRTADYGMFTIIASPLFDILKFVHKYIGNWGWSIILVTVLIKAVFYKLTATSGKSMAKMREMAPRLKALQERYKDNREELGRATMEFYKREKINPLASCLPTLIQMPVWMAFYWVILNSAEMRQAPFIGYLTDLSSRDPYFILPIILGIVNFLQFRLNPAPADPAQAKVMMFMPIVMTGMMAWFPSGLALYWITNTALSILQQWHINRVVTAQTKKS